MTAPPISSFPPPVREYLGLSFPDPPGDRPYVILNMVASADGKAVIGDTESGLSSSTDKLVLQSLRAHAGAVLNGAGTARATGVNPSVRDVGLRAWRTRLGHSGAPLQVLLTRTAHFPPGAPFLRQTDFRLVVFVSGPADRGRLDALRATGLAIEVVPDGENSTAEMMRRLRTNYGIRLLLLEGGPSLNAAIFHAGMVDEYFLTIGPHVVGGADTLTPVEGDSFTAASMPNLELVSALPNQETSEVYLHWRVSRTGC